MNHREISAIRGHLGQVSGEVLICLANCNLPIALLSDIVSNELESGVRAAGR